MRRILTCVMVTVMLGFTSLANAGPLLDWNLDLSSLGGPAVTNINGIGMNGSVHLEQEASGAPLGKVAVGDTFTITNAAAPALPINFTGVSYVDSGLNQLAPLLGAGQGVLSIQSSLALTGVVDALLGANLYSFKYDIPAATVFTLNYLDSAAVNHVIAEFSMLPSSGGISSDAFVSPNGQLSGSSNMYANMINILPGVLFTSGGVDLSTLPSVLASLSGILNYEIPDPANPLVATISSNNQFTLGVSAIPEPTTMLLLGGGMLGLSILRRRNKNS